MSYSIGGGGGVSPSGSTATEYALDQPFEVSWPLNADQLAQLNEMLSYLFKNVTKVKAANDALAAVPATTSALSVANYTLTDAQVKSLNTAPVTILAAPGAKRLLVPIFWSVNKDSTAGAYSASATWSIRYVGDTTALMQTQVVLTAAANKRYQATYGSTYDIVSDMRNTALEVFAGADVTGGNNANSIRVSVVYYVMTTA